MAPAEDLLLGEKTVGERNSQSVDADIPGSLSDEELDEYLKNWQERRRAYREASMKLPKSDPDRFRLGWSGYWCSKIQDAALREKERRRTNGL